MAEAVNVPPTFPQHLPFPSVLLLFSAGTCKSPPEGFLWPQEPTLLNGVHQNYWELTTSRSSSPPVMERVSGEILLLPLLMGGTTLRCALHGNRVPSRMEPCLSTVVTFSLMLHIGSLPSQVSLSHSTASASWNHFPHKLFIFKFCLTVCF